MSLSPGTRLGPYELTAQIGAGGMGEVYRGHDATLNRDAAIKVLPAAVADDPERLARFRREAQVLASLNHPNIAHVHGFEGAKLPDGSTAYFLAMEMVEGEDLSERLQRGAIPTDEAIALAKQIAEGLEDAHEHGIIHRDLKPANIKLTAEGKVKILDFGLAKALEGDPTSSQANAQLSHSPTMSRHMTEAGMIMGTAAYMSPEQARGKTVDKRADIWSFGVVVFEMLTGTRLFAGETVSDTLAAVLKEEVPWDRLTKDTPGHVTQMLKRCLVRTPRQRLRDIGDARLALDGAFETMSPQAAVSAAVALPLWRRALPFAAVAVVSGLVVGVAGRSLWRRADRPQVTRTVIAQPANEPLYVPAFSTSLALSPDGTRVVYLANVEGATNLMVRSLDELEATVLVRRTPRGPFFSPDGAWVGFHDQADDTIKRIATTGGAALTIGALGATLMIGATWGEDDTIIFGTDTSSGLWRVPVGGGTPEPLTTLNEAEKESNHEWPDLLPGGKAILFSIRHEGDDVEKAQIMVRHLGTGEQRVLVSGGSHPKYVSSGHIVYAFAGTLRAVPFDLGKLAVTGNPVGVLERLSTKTTSGAADMAVARDGSLVYVDGATDGAIPRTLTWVDRQGREEAIPAPVRTYTYLRLSPDGRKIALDIRDQENDIWIWDLTRTTLTRLTFHPSFDGYPVWTPDGQRIVFSTDQSGTRNLNWRAADGTGAVERLTESQNLHFPSSFSPDGAQLVFEDRAQGADLAVLNIVGDGKTAPLLETDFSEYNGEISPDGRWLAYQSDESGRNEVYIRPFPNVDGGRWQVSTGGGTRPLWARDVKEIFYLAPDGAVMRVGVTGGTTFTADTPTRLFQGPYFSGGIVFRSRTYDVSPDGKRFLMIKNGDENATPPTLILVQNWFEELKRLVPTR